MVNFVNKNILDSNENIIISPIDCGEEFRGKIVNDLIDKYPHIEKEYNRYKNKMNKNHLDVLGNVLYIPTDNWASGLFGGDSIDKYDSDYQYIANIFCLDIDGGDNPYHGKKGKNVDVMSIERALMKIKEDAEKINASIAVPFDMCNYAWGTILALLKKIFDSSKINVVIYKKY